MEKLGGNSALAIDQLCIYYSSGHTYHSGIPKSFRQLGALLEQIAIAPVSGMQNCFGSRTAACQHDLVGSYS